MENAHVTEHTKFAGVKEMTGNLFLDDFAHVPMVQRYQKQGLEFDDAVNVFENFIAENPFLAVFEARECDFKTPDDYDRFLVASWGAACEVTNYDMDLALEAVFGDNETYYYPTTEVVQTVQNIKAKLKHSNDPTISTARKIKHRVVDKNFSPIWQGLKNQMEHLIGDEAAKEEVIKSSKLLEVRRLFLKLLSVYYSKFILSAVVSALLPGGFAMWIIKQLIFLVAFVGRGAYYAVSAKRMAIGGDPQHENAQKRCLYELELELKMVREKINDARSHGKEKEKYQLMRVEAAIEREIFRIRHGIEPDRNLTPGNN